MEKYRGKTLEEWRKFIQEDKQIGIRTTKYILVLEELVEELQSKLHQSTVISSVCECKDLPKGEIAVSSKALTDPNWNGTVN